MNNEREQNRTDRDGFIPDAERFLQVIREGKTAPAPKVSLRRLSDIQEKEIEWLIPGWVPRGGIAVMGGDGGTGKGLVCANIAAGISSNGRCILTEDIPFDLSEDNRTVLILNAEDDDGRVLKPRLKASGAVEENIFVISPTDRDFAEFKTDDAKLEVAIKEIRPSLVIIDPLQAFVPSSINMGARNAMRSCLAPLIALGEKYGTAFLIVMHTNKQIGVWGRKRLADSADMWDISRSVLMVGKTIDGEKYVSNEKNNYGPLAETVLFSIDEERVAVKYAGTSPKRDQEFVSEHYQEMRSAPAREGAENMILSYLMDHDGEDMEAGRLEKDLLAAGVTAHTLRKAKESLKASGMIQYRTTGGGQTKKWYVSIGKGKNGKK